MLQLPDFPAFLTPRQSAAGMIRYCAERPVQHPRRANLPIVHLGDCPEYAAGNTLGRGALPKRLVACREHEAVRLRESQCEGVSQRQGRNLLPKLKGERDAISVQLLYPQAEALKMMSAMIPQFPFVEKIGYDELIRQPLRAAPPWPD